MSVAARADEIRVGDQAYVDVVETTDGSSWVGVLVEQVPGDHDKLVMADGSVRVIKAADVVKITKRPNPVHAVPAPASPPVALLTCAPIAAPGIAASAAEPPPPQTQVRSGLRVSAAVDVIFPIADISGFQDSYAPEIRIGYERVAGQLGLGAGAMMRYDYWSLPELEDPNDAAWLLETHAYAQATYHVDRAAVLAGTTIGLDTNYLNINAGGTAAMSKTTASFGMNLYAGVELDYLPQVALAFTFDYHPPTDTVVSGASTSISYLAATAGAIVRL
jgi:hypothetical protein